MSSKELFERVRDLSLGLSALGMAAAIASRSSRRAGPSGCITDLAVLRPAPCTVPIYPTLSAAQARYILQDCGGAHRGRLDREQLEKIQEVRHQLPALEAVVVMDAAGREPASPSVLTFDERERARPRADGGASGARRGEFRDAARAVRAEQLATIIYTSGHDRRAQGRDADARQPGREHDSRAQPCST